MNSEDDSSAGVMMFEAVQPLLPPGQMVTADMEQRTLMLTAKSPSSVPLAVQHFSRSEWCVLLTLLRCYPTPCSQEHLVAAVYGASSPSQAMVRLLRVIISRLRPKLTPFALEVTSLVGKGYTLTAKDTNHP